MLTALISLALVGSAAITGVLAALLPRGRTTSGIRAFIVFLLGASFFSLAYAFELSGTSLEVQFFWRRLRATGALLLPTALFLFAAFTRGGGIARWLKTRNWIVLTIMPALTAVLIWTNSSHRLIWRQVTLVIRGSLYELSYVYGPWYWVNGLYSYALLLTGLIMLGSLLRTPMVFQRRQVGLVLLGFLVPWVTNILFSLPRGQLTTIDLTPFSFAFSGIAFYASQTRWVRGLVGAGAGPPQEPPTGDGIMILDPQGRIVDLNKSARDILDRQGDSAVGLPFVEILPGTEGTLNADAHAVAVSKVRTRKGLQGRPVGFSVDRLDNGHLEPMLRVVTLRSSGSESEQEEEDWFRDRMHWIAKSTPAAMLFVNVEEKIVLANSQAEALFGYEHHELLGLDLQALIPKRFRQDQWIELSQFFAGTQASQEVVRLEVTAVRRDGREFPAEFSLSPLRTPEGLLVGMTFRDNTEKEQIAISLRETDETYRALFENANDAIFLLNLQGVHLQVNQKAADMLGYKREDLVGKHVSDIVVPEEYAEAEDRLVDLINGKTLPMYERTFRRKDGSPMPVEINVSLVRDTKNQPRYIQSIVRDISQRKSFENAQREMIQEARRSREQMRSLKAHVLQVIEEERRLLAAELHDQVGPKLTGLGLNLGIIRDQLDSKAKRALHKRLEDSSELLQETTRLVRNVMTDLHPLMLDDYGIAAALHWLGEQYMERTQIQTTFIGEQLQPRLPAEAELALFRIAQEALNNITKHAQADRVIISLSSSPKIAVMGIKDNGRGFDPAATPSKIPQGHYGLMHMQERARSVGGHLTLTSAPGRGTSISIEVPRET